MEDNLSYMKYFQTLNGQEQIVIRKAQEAINGVKSNAAFKMDAEIFFLTKAWKKAYTSNWVSMN